MIINLMKNNSPNNKIYKSATLIQSVSGELRSDTDIINPVVEVSGIDSNITNINYAYIPDFKRYYYVDDIVVIAPNLVQLNMTVDVLMSHADEIMNQYAVIERQQYDFNMELRDVNIPTLNATRIQYIKFPNSFTNYKMVIPLLGN